MTTSKLLGVVLVAIGLFGLAAGGRLSIPDMGGLVSNAEARVGRPGTPVSVAGAARRTVRRCAAGVYDC
jgi:hypothetical protein